MWESSSIPSYLKLVKAWRQWLLQNPSVSLWKLRNAFLHCRPSVMVWYLSKFSTCGLLQDDARVWHLFWRHVRFIINKWQAGYSEAKLVRTTSLWQAIHTGVPWYTSELAVLPNCSCLPSSHYFCFFQFTWVYALLIVFHTHHHFSIIFFYLRTQMSFRYASRAILFSCRCAILSLWDGSCH